MTLYLLSLVLGLDGVNHFEQAFIRDKILNEALFGRIMWSSRSDKKFVVRLDGWIETKMVKDGHCKGLNMLI